MEKEKVTEELVRQNGNQAAAVMADYASQGGGGGGSTGGITKDAQSTFSWREPTEEERAKFSGFVGTLEAVAEINGVLPTVALVNEGGSMTILCLSGVTSQIGESGSRFYASYWSFEMGSDFELAVDPDWTLVGVISLPN